MSQANTLITENLDAVLCDFGLAKAGLPSGLTTVDAEFKGSILFCSPELFFQVERSTGSDIWAWACLVLEVSLLVSYIPNLTRS